MLSVYTGTPGTGKSLHVCEDIKQALHSGRHVITNFEFRDDLIKHKGEFLYLPNKKLKYPDFFYDYGLSHNVRPDGSVIMGNTLVVIDECQNLFDARQWNTPGRREWNEFAAQHRKYGFDIILITQSKKSLDKRLLANTEFEVEHRNMKHYKALGLILSLFFMGHLFVWVKRYLATKEKVSSKWFIGSKRKFKYYNSFKIFDSDVA